MNGQEFSATADTHRAPSIGAGQSRTASPAVPSGSGRTAWLARAVAAVVLGGTCLAARGQAAPPGQPLQPAQPGTPPLSEPPGVAPAKPGTGAGPPPPYHLSRWGEDYSYLKDPARRTDFWDPIKYIPLNEEGDWYLSLGGQVRYRYEFYEDNALGAGPQDDTGFHLLRTLVHADLHLGKNLRGFIQGKSALEDGRFGGPRPADDDQLDLQQAFVDLILPLNDNGATVTIRGGRQDLFYGAQRFVSPLDWTNVRRTFEGGKVSVQFSKTHSLDAFIVSPVLVEEEEGNSRDGDTVFYGIYDTIGLPNALGFKPEDNTKLDLYGFALIKELSAYPTEGAGLEEDRYTVGARFSSSPKPFDFDLEATYQFGDLDGGDISAWSLASKVGYTLADMTYTPRVYVGFDIASGDDDPGDGDSETFNQLFPLAHPYFGFLDLFGRQNIVDLHTGVELTLLKDAKWAKKVMIQTDVHGLWRQSDDDAVYNSAGGVLRPDAGSGQRYLGSEVDVLLNWQVDRHLSAYTGYSHFFPGDFFDDAGPDEDVDWVYAAVVYTF
jgi:hypothetical protein